MTHPRVDTLADDEDEPVGQILPVYGLTEGLQQWQMRKIIRGVLEEYADCSTRSSRPAIWNSTTLAARRGAAGDTFSQRPAMPGHSRRRLVYQELFILQLALAVKRRQQHEHVRLRRWRQRPRSTPASAGCSPSS